MRRARHAFGRSGQGRAQGDEDATDRAAKELERAFKKLRANEECLDAEPGERHQEAVKAFKDALKREIDNDPDVRSEKAIADAMTRSYDAGAQDATAKAAMAKAWDRHTAAKRRVAKRLSGLGNHVLDELACQEHVTAPQPPPPRHRLRRHCLR